MRGYGHVEFATAEAAQKALEFANHDLMGRPVRVDIAVERGAYTPGSGRDNGSFHKSAPRSGNTVFIKGFNTSSGEDEVILCCFCHHCFSIFSNNFSLYLTLLLC